VNVVSDSEKPLMNLFLLLLLGAVWGSSYLFIKVIVGEVPVLTLVAGRLTLSAVIAWLLLPLLKLSIPRDKNLWATYALMGLLNGAIPYVLISWGEQYISSGLAALLQSTMPFFTVILAHFMVSDERLTPASVVGVVVGFVGVGILLFPDLREGLQASLLGQLAIVGSSVSYAAATIVAHNRLRGQPPMQSTMGQFTMGAAFILPLALILDQPFDLSPSWAAIGSWLGLAVLGTVVAYAIYYALITRAGATYTSMVTYIIPIFALILGAVVMRETLSGGLLAGLALILLGVLLVRR
jgi:drug/metabolite transporter (DMT)-like permease